MSEGTDYTDGQWIATTMGQFIQILIDSGHDPAVIFRVDDDNLHGDGSFTRHMTVFSIPNGHVVNTVKQFGDPAVYKVLAEFIRKGVIT